MPSSIRLSQPHCRLYISDEASRVRNWRACETGLTDDGGRLQAAVALDATRHRTSRERSAAKRKLTARSRCSRTASRGGLCGCPPTKSKTACVDAERDIHRRSLRSSGPSRCVLECLQPLTSRVWTVEAIPHAAASRAAPCRSSPCRTGKSRPPRLRRWSPACRSACRRGRVSTSARATISSPMPTAFTNFHSTPRKTRAGSRQVLGHEGVEKTRRDAALNDETPEYRARRRALHHSGADFCRRSCR